MDNQQVRLNKFLAERLGCSRREADEIIQSGKITVDGKTAELGARIDKSNKVCYNKRIVPFQTEYLYLVFHKPVGYVCSRHQQGDAPTIYSILPRQYRNLKTVGRLDKDSSGLILLTNDGDFSFRMTHPKFRKTKVYEVELDHSLEPLHQQMISDYGVVLEDGISKFKVITSPVDAANEAKAAGVAGNQPSRTHFTVILTEGRNRQIRRTFAALGYRVTKLHRASFGKYELDSLREVRYDVITP